MPETRGVRFRVGGRVQGVGFRWAAARAAGELGISGWVMNRSDGDVQGYACGSEAALAAFVEWLGRGPAQARVERLETAPAVAEAHPDFSIR